MSKKKLNYDQDTMNFDDMVSEERWCRILPSMLKSIVNTNKYGQEAICGIITLLNDNTIDHKTIIGDLKYRYKLKCSQNKLAKLIGMDSGNLSKGLKELEKKNLIHREDGIIYVNPFLANNNQIVSKDTAKKFNVKSKTYEPIITRTKEDESHIRKDLEF